MKGARFGAIFRKKERNIFSPACECVTRCHQSMRHDAALLARARFSRARIYQRIAHFAFIRHFSALRALWGSECWCG